MNPDAIVVRGARTHNLKNVTVEIPRHRLVVFSGVSGSGKSSLLFDTLYTEAQRQLIETFSAFARRRLPKLSRPPLEEIENISTAIVIDQKRLGTTLRSTVGTATEVYTYLRMLFSRFGDEFVGPSFVFSFNHPQGMCPACKGLGKRIVVDGERLLDRNLSLRQGAVTHPDYKPGGWNWRELTGSGLFDIDRRLADFTPEEIEKLLHAEGIPIQKPHGITVYAKKFEGVAARLERLHVNKGEDQLSEARRNAYQSFLIHRDCEVCGGVRLNERARRATLRGRSLPELVNMELTELEAFLAGLEIEAARPLICKMRRVLGHLVGIGVGYLSLNRAVSTLSGGESQRLKMARQLDCDLVDLMYILDEPSIGLHPRDNARLIDMLGQLRDKGNSVLVVEHDPAVIEAADWVIDIGPGAGAGGGEVLFSGGVADLKRAQTPTGQWLNRRPGANPSRRAWSEWFEIREAAANNLKRVSLRLPKGVLTCVTGVAGSGKSSLIHEVFARQHPQAVVVDQSAAGRSSRSNPATYIGVFDFMRRELAAATGGSASLFSFNSSGACPACKGMGVVRIEMSFLDDVQMICGECQGRRFRPEVLDLKCRGKSIDEILRLTVGEASEFFAGKEIRRRLQVLAEVGLGYLEIGQSLSSLSGGEAQRIKLAAELHKRGGVYILDEPTTGLHPADIAKLMAILQRLVSGRNTVVVIEHNLEVISQSDWVIDLGPEGGREGGEIVAQGTPEELAQVEGSHTGRYLARHFRGIMESGGAPC